MNLGHTLRKQRRYDEAVQMLQRALGLCPGQPGTYSALGYTYHLQVHSHPCLICVKEKLYTPLHPPIC